MSSTQLMYMCKYLQVHTHFFRIDESTYTKSSRLMRQCHWEGA